MLNPNNKHNYTTCTPVLIVNRLHLTPVNGSNRESSNWKSKFASGLCWICVSKYNNLCIELSSGIQKVDEVVSIWNETDFLSLLSLVWVSLFTCTDGLLSSDNLQFLDTFKKSLNNPDSSCGDLAILGLRLNGSSSSWFPDIYQTNY